MGGVEIGMDIPAPAASATTTATTAASAPALMAMVMARGARRFVVAVWLMTFAMRRVAMPRPSTSMNSDMLPQSTSPMR